jgi:hypothetical protein
MNETIRNNNEFELLDLIEMVTSHWIVILIAGTFVASLVYFLTPIQPIRYFSDIVVAMSPAQASKVEHQDDDLKRASGTFQYTPGSSTDIRVTRVRFVGTVAADVRNTLAQYATSAVSWQKKQSETAAEDTLALIQHRLSTVTNDLSSTNKTVEQLRIQGGGQVEMAPILSLQQQLSSEWLELELVRSGIAAEIQAIENTSILTPPTPVAMIGTERGIALAVLAGVSTIFFLILALLFGKGFKDLSSIPEKRAKIDRIVDSLLIRRRRN